MGFEGDYWGEVRAGGAPLLLDDFELRDRNKTMAVFMRGLKLRNYRGIGLDAQEMVSFQDINFFIGRNNSGKSAILNFITNHLPCYGSASYKRNSFDGFDYHGGSISNEISGSLAIDFEKLERNVLELFVAKGAEDSITRSIIGLVRYLSNNMWVPLNFAAQQMMGARSEFENSVDLQTAVKIMPMDHWSEIWRILTSQSAGDLEHQWLPEVLIWLSYVSRIELPDCKIIPAIREIGKKGENFSDFSGVGLIDKLAEMQNPNASHLEDRKIFTSINKFLQDVTGESSACINIPHDRSCILADMSGKTLPLESLGTGIHEVIMIASFCMVSRGIIICMEEPEIHLHPILQKKLVHQLLNHTSNQYFIATHSASFIDTEGSAIFHVENDGLQTRVGETILKRDKFQICHDLGYRASDILQANSVIWVEGPSDRIYLNRWISAKDNSLQEGIHYSVMFYGGRLLSHLTGGDEATSAFLNLMSLNRNSGIVIDSDKNSESADINETKKRVHKEFSESSGFAWVTSGREIENYVLHLKLQDAVKEVHPKLYGFPSAGGQYNHALHFLRAENSKIETEVDKVRVAHLVCEKEPDFSVLDLDEKVRQLVVFIRKANGLPAENPGIAK
jgi:predicted ATPase